MNKLLKQHNIRYVGTFIHIFYFSLPMIGVLAQCGSLITMYGVWRPSIMAVFPWLTLPIFFAMVIALGLIVLFIAYKFLYRNFYAFQNSQQFPEDSPVMRAIRRAVREELKSWDNEHR